MKQYLFNIYSTLKPNANIGLMPTRPVIFSVTFSSDGKNIHYLAEYGYNVICKAYGF